MSYFEDYAGYRIEIVKDITGPSILKDWSETEYESQRARVCVHPLSRGKYAAQVLKGDKWMTLCKRGTDVSIRFNNIDEAESAAIEDMRTTRRIAHGDW
jgi:hypothetical protein